MMADWLIGYNTIILHHSLNMKNPVQYLIENHEECHILWINILKVFVYCYAIIYLSLTMGLNYKF